MTKKYSDWLSTLYNIDLYNGNLSFLDKMNLDLQIEFEKLTGFKFKGKEYFLFIKQSGDFSYYENDIIPFGRLRAELVFFEMGMQVSIIWFDKVSKNIYKPGDDISESSIEFHWENFDLLHPALAEGILEQTDIRNRYNLNVSFPVLSKLISLDTDYTLKILSLNPIDTAKIEQALAEIQVKWNAGNFKNQSLKKYGVGMIHSIEFIGYDEENRAQFEIDSGSAGFEAIKLMLQTIDKIGLNIQQVEIINS